MAADNPVELQFERFGQLSTDLVCTASLDGYFRWVNPRWSEVLGYTEDEMLARPFTDFVHPDDLAATQEEIKRQSDGQPTIRFVNRYRRKHGGWRILEWASTPPTNGIVYAIARDVTPTNTDARRVQLLELAQDVSKIGYWFVDLLKETVEWSPEIYRIHGVDPATYVPTLETGINAYHPDDRELVAAHVQRAIDEKEPFDFELRLLRPSGETRLVHSVGRPQLSADGTVTGVFGVFRDITDDHRVARQRELEQFAHVASHDLREPLRTIRSFIDLLEGDYLQDIDDTGREYLDFIRGGAARMQALLDGMLQLTQSARPIEPRPVNLGAVFADVVRDLEAQIEGAGAVVSVDVDARVLGDSNRLRQVFQNLLSNALKYCRSGVAPRVRVSSAVSGSNTIVSIVDNGIGIDPRHQARIFEPFQRLHSRAEFSGSGIGLAIVERVVRECRGRVWLESTPGQGSAFFVQLENA